MKGSCLCGSVSFALNLNTLHIYQCHCQQCRQQTGTASSCGAVVKQQHFLWHSGEHNISKWEKPSGFSSHFCSTCGSSVPNKFRGQPYFWVPAGLVNSDRISTVANIFTCEKANWSNVASDVNTHETKPSVESLIKLLTAD